MGSKYNGLTKQQLAAVSGAGNSLPSAGGTIGWNLLAARTQNATNCTVTDVTRVSESGQLLTGFKMQCTGAGTNSSIRINLGPVSKIASGLISLLVYVPQSLAALMDGPPATTPTMTFYIGNNGLANLRSQAGIVLGRYGWADITFDAASLTGGDAVFGTTDFSQASIRLDYPSGQSANAAIEAYIITEGGGCSPAPIVISVDDGWDTQYSLMAPIFETYGLRMSMGLIMDLLGKANYMTPAQVLELQARGHTAGPHGPKNGTGSYLNFASDPDPQASVLADMKFHRDAVIALCGNPNGEANYLPYPQGVEQFGPGDTRIRDAAEQAGFKVMRGTTSTRNDALHPWGSSYLRYASIVGHTWVSEATEAANIANIQARLIANANARRPSWLMLHRATTGTPTDQLFIKTSNLELLCQTIAWLIGQGVAYNTSPAGLYKAATGHYPV